MTTTTGLNTIDLVRFLMARTDEEDQALRKLARRSRDNAAPAADLSALDQSRRTIAAQRKVLGYVQELLVLSDLPREKIVRDLAAQILRAMVQPYQTHNMFRGEWLA